jgi:hypothetical protein
MAALSPVPRLTDIIEAIELIGSEMAGVTLDAFEPDRRKRWLVEPRPICRRVADSPSRRSSGNAGRRA